MRPSSTLVEAEFDPRLPKYFLLQSTFVLFAAIFTIPLIPIWLLFGYRIHKKQYDALGAALTDRSLNINKGFLFKVQKNIPLDKITDLAVNEGPILRYLGLCSLQIETAGGGQGSAMGQAMLPGVVDALAFRDKVLEQRDRVCGAAAAEPVAPPAAPAPAIASTDADVLIEIRDTLRKIESHLAPK